MLKERILSLVYGRLPELRTEIENTFKEYWVDPEVHGIYVIWVMSIAFCINRLLEQPEKNKMLLKKVFAMFEEMAARDDEEMRSFLTYTILDEFRSKKELAQTAVGFMGKETKKCWMELDEYWKQLSLWQLSQNQG